MDAKGNGQENSAAAAAATAAAAEKMEAAQRQIQTAILQKGSLALAAKDDPMLGFLTLLVGTVAQ